MKNLIFRISFGLLVVFGIISCDSETSRKRELKDFSFAIKGLGGEYNSQTGNFKTTTLSNRDTILKIKFTTQELYGIYSSYKKISFRNYPEEFFCSNENYRSPSIVLKITYEGMSREVKARLCSCSCHDKDSIKSRRLEGLTSDIWHIVRNRKEVKDLYKNFKPIGM